MIVTRVDRLDEFSKRLPDAKRSLEIWLTIVRAAAWRNPAEARRTFASLDPVVPVSGDRRVAVFNIGGNKYRLIGAIDYQLGVVNVLRIMTHREYSMGRWKDSV